MASREETQNAILDLIVEASTTQPTTGMANDRLGVHKAQAEAILKLSEAWAWLGMPNQSH